jgi:NADP-dependent 3-hydroxy acid dehydrogenase YdfG
MTDGDAFAGRVALVTGAGGGIGGAIAAALAARGAAVHALARRLPENPAGLSWKVVDLDDATSVEQGAAALAADLQGLDVLVHAAGAYATGRIAEAPLADLDRLWRINLRAPWALTRAFVPALVRRRGWVVFINSSVWGAAREGLGGYAASKFALKAMADSLRAELNAEGVRVLSVFPGRTASRMQAAVHREEGKPYKSETLLQPDDIAAAVMAALALPRTAEATDLHIRPALKG